MPRRTLPRLAPARPAAFALLLLLTSPAAAQEGQPLTFRAVDDVVAPGTVLVVEGEGWQAGTRVRIEFDGTPLSATTVRDEGGFSTEIGIPEDAAPGRHTLRAVGTSEEEEPATLSTQVILEETATPQGWLVTLIVLALVVLAILVLAGVFLNQRRRTVGAPQPGAPSTQEPAPTPGERQPRRP
ncbi:MAG TPA: hypothetical protein VHL78_05735 [Actinomycetota bacterium]|nr:hypothetical protein [Actinomycetota bacterium]